MTIQKALLRLAKQINRENQMTKIIEGKEGMTHSLDLLSDTYNYNHWIYSVMRPHIGDAIVEVGSGPGNLTRFILAAKQLICIEPDAEFTSELAALCKPHANVTLMHSFIHEINPRQLAGWPFDTVLSANVLEHISDDAGAMRSMADMLKPGGKNIVFVPAVSWAYGAMDEKLGHVRRYSKRGLIKLFEESGFENIKAGYFNFLGLFGWWFAGRIMRDDYIDPRKARVMDRLAPYISAVERFLPPIIGQSLICVGTKRS